MILPERLNYMTNPLIPNTFVPGTKAKAQEVNANFIALAEEIQGTQSNTKEQFEQLRSEIDEKMDYVAENYAQKNLVNTNSITNSVLEAPNGVALYDGQTITIQQGVKILIPNGRDINNKMNNLEYKTEEQISKTVTNLTDIDTAVFLDNTGNLEVIPQKYIFYKNSTPSTLVDNVHWYYISENKWYKYVSSESRWIETFSIPIANVTWNTSSTISDLTTTQPINLIKSSDLQDFYTLRGVLPKDLDYVVKRYRSGWNSYAIYKSGWVKQTGYCDAKGDAVANFYIPMQVPYAVTLARLTGASTTSDVSIWFRGDPTSTYIRVYSSATTGKMWCVEGLRENPEEI